MTIQDIFPQAKASYFNDNQKFWTEDILSPTFDDFLELMEAEFERAAFRGIDAFHKTAMQLLEDIIAAKENAPTAIIEILDFLQFIYGATCADYFNNNGIFSHAHDWLIWSLSDEIEYSKELIPLLDRIQNLYNSRNQFLISHKATYHILWMKNLFYCSRHLGGLKDLSKLILYKQINTVLRFSKTIGLDFNQKDALELACQMLAWSINNHEPAGYPIAKMLEEWIPSLEPNNQKLAYLQLATGGSQFTDKESDFFAKQIIKNYSHLCIAHELLHVQAIFYTAHIEELESNPDLLTKAWD